MKTLNVRELRSTIPHLEETLAIEGELLLVSNGRPIARLISVVPSAPRKRLPSLKAFRARMPTLKTPSQALIREDRDRRGS
jgi:antitoxin (DNA-binding transcriptional repressor) of toxin-antitoxin stability system